MIEFRARAVAALRDEELNIEMIVLAEAKDGSGRRLEIQRPIVVSNDDREIGHDTYCLVSESGAAYYGGVTDWSLADSELEVRVSDEAGEVLGAQNGYRIRIEAEAVNFDALAVRLEALLGVSDEPNVQ